MNGLETLTPRSRTIYRQEELLCLNILRLLPCKLLEGACLSGDSVSCTTTNRYNM